VSENRKPPSPRTGIRVHLAQNATAETLERGRPFHHQQPCDACRGVSLGYTPTRHSPRGSSSRKPLSRNLVTKTHVIVTKTPCHENPPRSGRRSRSTRRAASRSRRWASRGAAHLSGHRGQCQRTASASPAIGHRRSSANSVREKFARRARALCCVLSSISRDDIGRDQRGVRLTS
jgi:hypothetical protein